MYVVNTQNRLVHIFPPCYADLDMGGRFDRVGDDKGRAGRKGSGVDSEARCKEVTVKCRMIGGEKSILATGERSSRGKEYLDTGERGWRGNEYLDTQKGAQRTVRFGAEPNTMIQ